MTADLVQLCVSANCSNPARDGFICDACTWSLQADLRAIPEVLDDLLVTFARADVGDRQPSGRVEVEPPLLFRPHAADARDDLHQVLLYWVRALTATLGGTVQDAMPVGPAPSQPWLDERNEWVARPVIPGGYTIRSMALWLDRHRWVIRMSPSAGELVDEVGDAVARAQRATDRPGERIYLGPCDDCVGPNGRQVDLYARPDAARATCRSCEQVYGVAARREWLLEQSAEMLVTPELAARALPQLLGYDVTPDLLRRLVRREGLERHPPAEGDPHRRDRFRVGDIALCIAVRKARAEARTAVAPPLDELPSGIAALFEAARRAAANRVDQTGHSVRDA